MKLDPAVFNSAEDMMSIAQADLADEQKQRAGRKVIGPHGGAKARFEEWFANENFAGLSTHEIASLGFDAGHAFCHTIASALPAQPIARQTRDYPTKHYTAAQKAWCIAYEFESGFEPMLDEYESGEKTFTDVVHLNIRWYEDHTKDSYLRLSDIPYPDDDSAPALPAAQPGEKS